MKNTVSGTPHEVACVGMALGLELGLGGLVGQDESHTVDESKDLGRLHLVVLVLVRSVDRTTACTPRR